MRDITIEVCDDGTIVLRHTPINGTPRVSRAYSKLDAMLTDLGVIIEPARAVAPKPARGLLGVLSRKRKGA